MSRCKAESYYWEDVVQTKPSSCLKQLWSSTRTIGWFETPTYHATAGINKTITYTMTLVVQQIRNTRRWFGQHSAQFTTTGRTVLEEVGNDTQQKVSRSTEIIQNYFWLILQWPTVPPGHAFLHVQKPALTEIKQTFIDRQEMPLESIISRCFRQKDTV